MCAQFVSVACSGLLETSLLEQVVCAQFVSVACSGLLETSLLQQVVCAQFVSVACSGLLETSLLQRVNEEPTNNSTVHISLVISNCFAQQVCN